MSLSTDPSPAPYNILLGPEISFVVNQVCQFLQQPRTPRLTAVKRILSYLKGTITHGLFYKHDSLQIQVYSDADWVGSITDRQSTIRLCVYLGLNLISWCAKKQPPIARSSAEAEYRSLAPTSVEIRWLLHMLRDLHIPINFALVVHCDNISVIDLASNLVFHTRTKRIKVDYHFIRELVLQKRIVLKYLCSADQLADIFTKGLSPAKFCPIVAKLLVLPPNASLRGCDEGNNSVNKSNMSSTSK